MLQYLNRRAEVYMLDAPSLANPVRGEDLRVRPAGEKRLGDEPSRAVRVFVHLARDKDARAWREARQSGTLVGVNDETPYGYGRAQRMGCEITFSRSEPETAASKLTRLAFRALLGFDLVHALRQRQSIPQADIVWTHTESQYLAVAALLLLSRTRTRLLGQTVWLMDRWPRLGVARRALYRRLIRRVDVLTFHSPANQATASAEFPDKAIELVRFGIPSERWLEPRPRPGRPIRVLALGNDEHRDWRTLIDAVGDQPEMSLLIRSGSLPSRRTRGAANVEIRVARTQSELSRSFAEATLVCVPLRSNLHASGVTVIQEAVLAGVPVVATDTGGLDAYFARDEVRFVPVGDVAALREALREVASEPEAACAQARRAQARMIGGHLGAEAYIRRHVELTREILEQ
jgi:glycosyltransferase involved in cell wall biosynthesis